MLDITCDIDSLSRFKRNTADYLRQMKKTGQPVVLTVNGKAELVVQDAASYQKLLDLIDRLQTVQELREGLDDVEKGRVRPAEEALQEIKSSKGTDNVDA